MPGMPFHLEKGHGLMALEDLLNDPTHRTVLAQAWEGLRSGAPLGQLFATIVKDAPALDNYGNNPLVPQGLGQFVQGAWFGQASATGPSVDSYWLDFDGNVDEIVRQALLFAMEMAGPNVTRSQPLPPEPFGRRIELLWHCGQRWFEAWLTWEDRDTISVLFATPPHAYGEVVANVADAGPGQTTVVTASTANPDRDMILVGESEHVEHARLELTWWPTKKSRIALPSIGVAYEGAGTVGVWSVHANSGGMNPETTWT